MYTTLVCPYCMMAKRLLSSKNVEVEEVRVDQNPELRDQMLTKAGGRRTVPRIFAGEKHLGGYDDIVALDRKGELDPILDSTT